MRAWTREHTLHICKRKAITQKWLVAINFKGRKRFSSHIQFVPLTVIHTSLLGVGEYPPSNIIISSSPSPSVSSAFKVCPYRWLRGDTQNIKDCVRVTPKNIVRQQYSETYLVPWSDGTRLHHFSILSEKVAR